MTNTKIFYKGKYFVYKNIFGRRHSQRGGPQHWPELWRCVLLAARLSLIPADFCQSLKALQTSQSVLSLSQSTIRFHPSDPWKLLKL